MVLVVIGPVTMDLILIGDESSKKVGGATYFQSFVFEKFYSDYMAIVNCADENMISSFPDSDKVRLIKKEDTHFFINNYPFADDLDVREQLSNFADIPILPEDLEGILPEKIEMTLVEVEPAVKGNTSTGATKTAYTETGLMVRVPLFIEQGERIIVTTLDGKYYSRA